MPSSAVIVIDLANDFVFAGGTIADAGGAEYQSRAQALVPRLARLLEAILSRTATDRQMSDFWEYVRESKRRLRAMEAAVASGARGDNEQVITATPPV